MDRRVDYRYAPTIVQTSVCFADDPHKTIVREDGSVNYDYHSRTLEFVEMDDIHEDRNRSQGDRCHRPQQDNLSFRYRLKPTFTHKDELVERTQEFGDPEAAIVTTTEKYEETTLSWTVFAHRDGDARVDVNQVDALGRSEVRSRAHPS